MVYLNLTVSQVPLTATLARQNTFIFSIVVPRHRPPTDDHGHGNGHRKRARKEPNQSSLFFMVADVLRDGNSSDGFYVGWINSRNFIVEMTRGYTMVSGVISNRHLEEPMEKVKSGLWRQLGVCKIRKYVFSIGLATLVCSMMLQRSIILLLRICREHSQNNSSFA